MFASKHVKLINDILVFHPCMLDKNKCMHAIGFNSHLFLRVVCLGIFFVHNRMFKQLSSWVDQMGSSIMPKGEVVFSNPNRA